MPLRIEWECDWCERRQAVTAYDEATTVGVIARSLPEGWRHRHIGHGHGRPWLCADCDDVADEVERDVEAARRKLIENAVETVRQAAAPPRLERDEEMRRKERERAVEGR